MDRTTVVGVENYELTDNGVQLDCVIDAEFNTIAWKCRDGAGEAGVRRTVPVTVQFYNSRIFRFEFTANPEAGPTETLNNLDEAAIEADIDLNVEERDGELCLDTGALQVVIGLEEWSFTVKDAKETTLFEEQREDVNVRGDPRVDPLGFSEIVNQRGPTRVTETGTAFSLTPSERIYGLGEKFLKLDRRGREITSWTAEPHGTETEAAYKNVPFHLSSRGYGLLVDTTNRVTYDIGCTTTASGTIAVQDDTFSFIFFYGPAFTDILQEYTALTGRVNLPPKWSFGVVMSRLGYESREHLESITDELREREIPCDVIHLDPFWMREFHSCDLQWDTDQFPDPESMINNLKQKGFHLSLWEHPYVPVGTEMFKKGRDNGYFVADATGKPYLLDSLCQGDYRGAIVDFTNPDAIEWWKEHHRRLVEMGADMFKTDYGEGVPADAVFANRRTGESMHNFYPVLYNQVVYEAIAEVNGVKEALVWGRSAWIGSQRFPIYWGGDAQTTFNGMASALRGGLSLSLSGFPFWSHDIGGFRGTPSQEVYVRWAQFGLLSSHARCHGTTPREPWAFGKETVRIFKEFAQLRYQLLSYLYSYAATATRTGIPVVRPLVLQYTDDPATHNIDLQYLLGEELLVAPVFNENGNVSVYLPNEHNWVDWWTGERYNGGQTLNLEMSLDRIPLFIRAGSILPLQKPAQTVSAGRPQEVTLRVTTKNSEETHASFDFYDEDADKMIEIECFVGDDIIDLSFGAAEQLSLFRAEVIDVKQAPETVRVNGSTLKQVDADPSPKKWSYKTDENLAIVNVGSRKD